MNEKALKTLEYSKIIQMLKTLLHLPVEKICAEVLSLII